MAVLTTLADLIPVEVFTRYLTVLTKAKTAVLTSGIAVENDMLNGFLSANGSNIFHVPSFRDLDSDAERVATETPHAEFTGGVAEPDPKIITGQDETCLRLSRNQSWSAARLGAALSGEDPIGKILDLVSGYWARRRQAALIAQISGIIADNAAAPVGSEHVQNDLIHAPGVGFSSSAVINAKLTMGDVSSALSGMLVHSIVAAAIEDQDQIDYIPDSQGSMVAVYRKMRLLIDDNMPVAGGVYDTWLFAPGAVQMGTYARPGVATAVERKEGASNGQGQDILYSRVEWIHHMVGHKWDGASLANGGPSNGDAATANTLAHNLSWKRVYKEREQIPFAVLRTVE